MTKDLTQGSPLKLIFSFSVHVCLGLLFQQLYSIVDTMIVGRFLGSDALAAVGSTGTLAWLIIGFSTGLCSGLVIPVAQAFGAHDESLVRRYVTHSAYIAAAFALVLSLAMTLGCGGALRLMNTPEEIFPTAHSYIRIIFLGVPATVLYNLIAGVIRSLGDSRTPVFFLAICSVLNIILDLFFILVLQMGAPGAALATILSQAVSGILCLIYAGRHYSLLRMTADDWKFRFSYIRPLCTSAIPMGLQYTVTTIGTLILQTFINGLGVDSIAAYTAGSRIHSLLCIPLDSMGTCMATYCGQNVGARKLDRLGQGMRSCTLLGGIYSAIALTAVLLFSRQLGLLFLDPGEEHILGEVSLFLITIVSFMFLLALVNIVRFSIQGMGFSRLAVIAGAMELVGRAVCGLVLVPLFGFAGACFASPLAWVLADAFLIPACFRCIRKLRQQAAA